MGYFLSVIFASFIIFGYVLFLNVKLKFKFEEALPATINIVALMLYIFSIFKGLVIGIYALSSISIILMILSVYIIFKEKLNAKEIVKSFFTPASCLFYILTAYYVYAIRYATFLHWDEYSHWGAAIKNLYITNELGIFGSGNISMTSYSPITTIWQYFFVNFADIFIQSLSYIAMFIWQLSLVIYCVKDIKWKKVYVLILSIFTIYAVIITLQFYRNTLYIDDFIGILTAYLFVVVYNTKKLDVKSFILITPSLSCLMLSKLNTIVLASCVVLYMLLKILYKVYINYKDNKQSNRLKTMISSLPKYEGLIFLMSTVASLISYISWYIITKIYAKRVIEGEIGLLEYTIKLITKKLPQRYMEITQNYFTALSDSSMVPTVIPVTIIVIFIFISVLIIRMYNNSKDKNSIIIFGISSFISAVWFMYSLLYAFCTSFDDVKSLEQSLFRYVSSFILALIVAIIAISIKDWLENKSKLSISIVIIILFVALSTGNFSQIIKPYVLKYPNIKHPEQEYFKTYTNLLIDENKLYSNKLYYKELEGKKVYIVSCGSEGFDYWITKYELAPIKANDFHPIQSWDLEPNIEKQHKKEQVMKSQEFMYNLKKENYTNVIILEISEDFNEEYAIYFEKGIVEIGTYEIDYSRQKLIKIQD